MWHFRESVSEAEFIERLRNNIEGYRRWRLVILGLYLVPCIVVAGLIPWMFQFVRGAGWPGVQPGFLVGLALGSSFGILAVKVVHGLWSVITFPGRAELTVVRYYDMLHSAGLKPGAGEGEDTQGLLGDKAKSASSSPSDGPDAWWVE